MRKRWWNPRIFPETREGSEIDWLAGAGVDMLQDAEIKYSQYNGHQINSWG
jgi:hypothetical protein